MKYNEGKKMPDIIDYVMTLLGAKDPPGVDRTLYQRAFGIDPSPQIIRKDPEPNQVPRPSPTPLLTPTPTPKDPQDFDQLIQLFAQKAAEQGFHPGVLASQFAAESQRGQSRFARERNNYLGLGAYTEDPGKAISFDSPEASMDYYLNLISTDPRYKQAFAVRDDPNAYLKELSRVPYATDPDYSSMITNTPEFRRFSNQ